MRPTISYSILHIAALAVMATLFSTGTSAEDPVLAKTARDQENQSRYVQLEREEWTKWQKHRDTTPPDTVPWWVRYFSCNGATAIQSGEAQRATDPAAIAAFEKCILVREPWWAAATEAWRSNTEVDLASICEGNPICLESEGIRSAQHRIHLQRLPKQQAHDQELTEQQDALARQRTERRELGQQPSTTQALAHEPTNQHSETHPRVEQIENPKSTAKALAAEGEHLIRTHGKSAVDDTASLSPELTQSTSTVQSNTAEPGQTDATLLKVAFLTILALLTVGVALGFSNRAVFYMDRSDLGISFSVWASLIGGALLSDFLDWPWLYALGGILAAVLAAYSLYLSWKYNLKKIHLAIPTGFAKIILAALCILTAMLAFENNGKTRRERKRKNMMALAVLAGIAALLWKLVNGKEVYARNNWDICDQDLAT